MKILLFVIGIAAVIAILDVVEFYMPMEFEDMSVNRHSLYVHLDTAWVSSPSNIVFDITSTWNKSDSIIDKSQRYVEFDQTITDNYGINELDSIHDKSFVRLTHQNNQCQYNFQPHHYRSTVDVIRQNIEVAMGLQLTNDPYNIQFPNVKNTSYSDATQESMLPEAFAHFIPICMISDVSSFDYSIRIDDKSLGANLYFVPSISEFESYKETGTFFYYTEPGCFAKNLTSHSGTCFNVTQDSGIMVIMPDDIGRSLVKVTLNIYENSKIG
jgi:hypothetical protein